MMKMVNAFANWALEGLSAMNAIQDTLDTLTAVLRMEL